jgi:pseudouridine kinase
MKVAISSMAIVEALDLDYIHKNHNIIKNANCLVLDGNLKQLVIDYIFQNYSEQDVFVDTVSTTKAMKFKNHLNKIYGIKPNKIEAEQLLETSIHTKEDYAIVVQQFLALGIHEVYISLGADGVIYGIDDQVYYEQGKEVSKANVTGAGDAFLSGIIYGYFQSLEHKRKITIANTLARLTLESNESTLDRETINEFLRSD